MRIRTLLAGLAVALVAVVGTGGAASAVEGDVRGHAEEECIHLLEAGESIDRCVEAPNPILPPLDEVIWGAISFALLFFILSKFAFPAVKKSMDQRTERIRSDLDGAESAKAEAQQVLDEYRAQLADARNESARIIEEARQTADALRRDQEARLQTELAEMRQRAQADVEATKEQVMADLRGEVAALAIGAAEVVVQRSLDRESQVQLIENYINQVSQQRG
jgi:F-type H+-transporting ATPase subunit b